MGKETKIGLGVIAVLLVAFAVVLALRLTGPSGDVVASADAEKTSADAKDQAAPAPKLSATTVQAAKPLLPPPLARDQKTTAYQRQTHQLLTIPEPPMPDADAQSQTSAGWAVAGNGQSRVTLGTPGSRAEQLQSLAPAPEPSLSEPTNYTLDPPSPQYGDGLSTNRYDQRRPAAGSQTTDYQSGDYRSRQSQSNYQSVSNSRGGAARYNSGNRQGVYGSQPTYAGRHTITPPPVAPREPAAALRTDGTYEVQPNDSYWLISKRLYGSGAYFKALAEHNRSEHPLDGQLRVGDCISTPALAKLVDSFPDLCPSPERRQTLAKRAEVMPVSSQYGSYYGGMNTYTVEEGDTLYDIARYELGDASRWVEIHELNRHLLQGDFDYLVPGMKLVMPSTSTDSLTRRPQPYQTPSQNTLRR